MSDGLFDEAVNALRNFRKKQEDAQTPYKGFVISEVCEELRSSDGKGGYNRGRAFEYLAGAGWVDPANEIRDLEFAKLYVEREIERLRADKVLEPMLEDVAKDGDSSKEIRKTLFCITCQDEITRVTRVFGVGDEEYTCINNHVDHLVERRVVLKPSVTHTKKSHYCERCDLVMNQHIAGSYFCIRCGWVES
jgi:hypothetical protein